MRPGGCDEGFYPSSQPNVLRKEHAWFLQNHETTSGYRCGTNSKTNRAVGSLQKASGESQTDDHSNCSYRWIRAVWNIGADYGYLHETDAKDRCQISGGKRTLARNRQINR